jgi:hypothetical protein
VLANPERVVLGVDPEGVEADRLEDVAPAHPHVATIGVGAGVRVCVPDVEALGRGIRELDEVVELVIWGHPLDVDLRYAISEPTRLPP